MRAIEVWNYLFEQTEHFVNANVNTNILYV